MILIWLKEFEDLINGHVKNVPCFREALSVPRSKVLVLDWGSLGKRFVQKRYSNGPPKKFTSYSPEPTNLSSYIAKGSSRMWLRILRWEHPLDHPAGPSVITSLLRRDGRCNECAEGKADSESRAESGRRRAGSRGGRAAADVRRARRRSIHRAPVRKGFAYPLPHQIMKICTSKNVLLLSHKVGDALLQQK